jgi:uncharacterized protein
MSINMELEILNSSRVVAIVGLSPNPERPSYVVGDYMMNHGYKVIPVNPQVNEIMGAKCYPDLISIPEAVDVVDIFRRSEDVPAVVEEAIKIKARVVWMQEGVINEVAAGRARDAGLKVVVNKCMKKIHQNLGIS